MKKYIDGLLLLLIPFLIVYLVGVFGTGQFDISKWSEEARECAVFFLIVSLIAIGGRDQ
jgi:hypothetical protein